MSLYLLIFFFVNSSDVDKIWKFRMKKLLNHGKKENFIKNFTEFELFCLSEKKTSLGWNLFNITISIIVSYLSCFYINEVKPIYFGWLYSRIILFLSGYILSRYSRNDHLKRICKRCTTLHNEYTHIQFFSIIIIRLSGMYNVQIEMSELFNFA